MNPDTSSPAEAGTTPYSLVMTTVDSDAAADDLAARIVESQLAACVQIVPLKSVYRWRGQVRREAEWLLLIKTSRRFDEVERFIRANHSYETPEVLRLAIAGGSGDYLQWLSDACGS